MQTTPAVRRPVRLVLALVLACGAALAGTAAAAPQTAPAQPGVAPHLELIPAAAVVQRDHAIRYTAIAVDAKGGRSDVTASTTFRFRGAAPCRQVEGTIGEVVCHREGVYHLTGEVDVPRLTSGPVELQVTADDPARPRIDSVDPSAAPPNREVVVAGATGTCNPAGRLLLDDDERSAVAVTGKFTARLRIPPGTVPGEHLVWLRVRCGKDIQDANSGLMVENRHPTPADDDASTIPDEPVTVHVTDNDTDPDGPDGYPTLVREAAPGPSRGRIEVRDKDQTIVYTPGEGFDRRGDRFGYAYCDVIGPDHRTACGTATVTVARTPPTPVPDAARITQDLEDLIPVTDNDKLPDNDALHVSRPPDHPRAAAVVDADHPGSIRYKPAEGFTGADSFAYDYCPVGVNAAAAAACPSATVTVTVEPPPVDPRIGSVRPDPTPPNREVVVKGTTGTCDKAATLTLDSQPEPATPVPIAGGQGGAFEARLQVPTGTYVGTYRLQLHVVCDGEPEVVGHKLEVANQRPDALDDQAAIATTPRASVPIKVLANDRDRDDPDGYEVRVAVERDPAHGTAEVQRDQTGDQAIGYTPGKGFADAGEDQFTYRYCDVVSAAGATDCDTATVRVTKLSPEPVDDPGITTVRDRPVVIDVMDNDRNVGKPDIARLQVKREPAPRGEPRPRSDGKIEYRPEQGFTGTDTFQYDYCGGPVVVNAAQPCPSATVTVTIERLPVPARIDSVDRNPSPPNREVVVTGTTGTCDKAATLTLDSAPEPARPVPLTGGRDGDFEARVQIPAGTFVDAYRLQLHVVCVGKPEIVGQELLVANQSPKATDDQAATITDTPVTIDVTDNDVDPDGDDGYRTSLDPGRPEHGTALEQQPGDRIRYRPEAGFTGEDRFPYRFCDVVDADGKRDCGTATVIVTVGEPPPEAVDDSASTRRDRPVRIDVTGNDRHPDPAKLHVSRPPALAATAVEQREPPAGILYTPARGFTGTDTFQYDYCGGSVVVDAAGRAACTPATVTVVVTKPDPVPVDDPDATTLRDQPVVLDVMGNDGDPDAARLRLDSRPQPSGRPELLPDGSIRYTPAPGFIGSDRFGYDYCGGPVDADAAGRACPAATVTVTVTATPVISSVRPRSSPAGRSVEVTGNTGSCQRAGKLSLQETTAAVAVTGDQDGGFSTSLAIPPGTFPGKYRLELRIDCKGQVQQAEATLAVTNRAPEAADDADTTTRDHSVTIDVTTNDRDPDDPDGYENLVLVTSLPAHGTAEVQPDQRVVYTPAGGFVGQDRFGYSLCDNVLNVAGAADCGDATVTVTVTDTPVISSVTPGSTPPGQPVQVVGNTGSCNRAGTLIFHGPVDLPLTVSADENGRFATGLTVPAGTFPQPYRLEIRVDCGGQVQRAEAALTVTNQVPVAVDDPATATPGGPVTIDVTANDHDPDDPDGYPTRVLVASQPAHGTAQAQPDQTIVYTPAEGFVGQDRFGYSLCDDVLNAFGGADCGRAIVTVTVSASTCGAMGGPPRLEVEPGKGPVGTRLRITAAVDRRLAACPVRFFLGGTPLGPDVRVAGDGSISAALRIPKEVKRGRSSVRLATMSAQTLAERPFEVVGGPIPWPVRLALGAGALLVGVLARIAVRRWRASRKQPSSRRLTELPDDVRAESHTRPVEVGVEPVADGTRTFAVLLQPHADPGTQTLER